MTELLPNWERALPDDGSRPRSQDLGKPDRRLSKLGDYSDDGLTLPRSGLPARVAQIRALYEWRVIQELADYLG
jgi:hypothetical protein